MEAQVEGRKQRGRQRITFESRIEEIGSRRGKTLAEIEKCGRVGGRHPQCCNGTYGNRKEEEDFVVLTIPGDLYKS
jgi:hypothetical protein